MVPGPQSLIPDPELDALVRRVDEDRWLASRFAPPDVRRRLIAIYALNYEIAHAAGSVTQGALGDIRLAWWREAVAEIYAGAPPRPHPALAAFAAAVRQTPLSPSSVEALIEARARDFEAEPFSEWSDVEAYLDATAGGVMRLAVESCGEAADDAFVRSAALAWGCVGLARAAPHWRARGRSVLPRNGGSIAEMLERAGAAFSAARAQPLAGAVFPALGYVSLAPAYLRALARGRTDVALFSRQVRLIVAAATGRL